MSRLSGDLGEVLHNLPGCALFRFDREGNALQAQLSDHLLGLIPDGESMAPHDALHALVGEDGVRIARELLESVTATGEAAHRVFPGALPAAPPRYHTRCWPCRDAGNEGAFSMLFQASGARVSSLTGCATESSWMEAILKNMHLAAIVVVDRHGNICEQWVPAEILERYQTPEGPSVGTNIKDIWPDDEVELIRHHIRKAFEDGESGIFDISVPYLDGTGVQRIACSPLRNSRDEVTAVVSFIHDVTELKKTQAALLRSERLAAAGTVAAGVFHEYNNIHTPLIGFLDMALECPDLPADCREMLERALDAALRGRRIIRDLRAFARPSDERYEPLELGSVIEKTMPLLTSQFNRFNARHEIRADGTARVCADAGQLSQILVNLVINGLHAMDGQDRRQLSITAGVEGEEAFLRVEDTGPGVPAEIRDRIFEPFFTTKEREGGQEDDTLNDAVEPARGSGLGLPVCQMIAERHGGRIELGDAPGGGAAFTLRLPLGGPQDEHPPTPRPDRR
jgi:signal transduction histidine kinase